MSFTLSEDAKKAMLDSIPEPVHAVAAPGKALLSFDCFRVEKVDGMMNVVMLMQGNPVAQWSIPAVNFDDGEVLTFAGFIGNTQISVN